MEEITQEEIDEMGNMNSYGVASTLAKKINEIVDKLNGIIPEK